MEPCGRAQEARGRWEGRYAAKADGVRARIQVTAGRVPVKGYVLVAFWFVVLPPYTPSGATSKNDRTHRRSTRTEQRLRERAGARTRRAVFGRADMPQSQAACGHAYNSLRDACPPKGMFWSRSGLWFPPPHISPGATSINARIHRRSTRTVHRLRQCADARTRRVICGRAEVPQRQTAGGHAHN